MNIIDSHNKREIFMDIENHLLKDEKPSVYLKSMINNEDFNNEPFVAIKNLVNVEQNLRFHPEGNVFNHTIMVVDEAAKRREHCNNPRNLMWAALLHDIGKLYTTKLRKGRLTSYNHDKVGAKEARKFLESCNEDQTFIDQVCSLVRWHMQSLFFTKNLPFKDLQAIIEEVDLKDFILLTTSDRLGRGDLDNNRVQEELEEIGKFEKVLKDISINQKFK